MKGITIGVKGVDVKESDCFGNMVGTLNMLNER